MKPTVPGRLHAQRLVGDPFGTVREAVRHLTGVQSQQPDLALWSVGRRTSRVTVDDVRAAVDAGEVVRTHVLRPTWHLVDPDDLPWLLALTGPRIRRSLAAGDRAHGLDEPCLDRCTEVLLAALADKGGLTRPEVAAHLAAAGLPSTGQALTHVLLHAEARALVAGGPLRGTEHTYVPLPPRPVRETRDELLAAVARRYGRGHGPFRDRDLAWWAGLTLGDARRGIQLGGLRPLDAAGATHWHLDEVVVADVPHALLLPTFDPWTSFARDPEDLAAYPGPRDDIARVSGLLVVDGRLAGRWGRAVRADAVDVQVTTGARATARLRRAVEAEAGAFARFVGREARVAYTP